MRTSLLLSALCLANNNNTANATLGGSYQPSSYGQISRINNDTNKENMQYVPPGNVQLLKLTPTPAPTSTSTRSSTSDTKKNILIAIGLLFSVAYYVCYMTFKDSEPENNRLQSANPVETRENEAESLDWENLETAPFIPDDICSISHLSFTEIQEIGSQAVSIANKPSQLFELANLLTWYIQEGVSAADRTPLELNQLRKITPDLPLESEYSSLRTHAIVNTEATAIDQLENV